MKGKKRMLTTTKKKLCRKTGKTKSRNLQNPRRQQPDNLAHAKQLRSLLLDELKKNGLDFPVTLSENAVSPFIIHLLTVPYQGAILTRSLHLDEISVAPGSACESETPGGSRALTAMGYSPKESFCGLRISLWKDNTPEEMRIFAQKLALCIKKY